MTEFPAESKPKSESNRWKPSWLKRLIKSRKAERSTVPSIDILLLEPPAAAKLSLIILAKIYELLCVHLEELDPESTFIKGISLLIFSPPSNLELKSRHLPTAALEGIISAITPQMMLNQREIVVNRVIEILVQITNLQDGRCWRKLCDGDIVQKLLPWFKYWDQRKPMVTSKIIGLFTKLAGVDSKTAAYLVHEKFVEDMLKYYTENNHSKEALAVLAKLTALDQDAFDEHTLFDAVQLNTIQFLFNSMGTITGQDLGTNSTDAIVILTNLARFRVIREKLSEQGIMTQTQGILDSLSNTNNSENASSTSFNPDTNSSIDFAANPGDDTQGSESPECRSISDPSSISVITIPNEVKEDKAIAAIRLIAELARHVDTREQLIEKKRGILDALVRLLKEEKDRQGSRSQLGPIAEQFFQALPVFVLFPQLRDHKLAVVGTELAKSAPITNSESEQDYGSKIAEALKHILGDNNGESDQQPGSNHREIAASFIRRSSISPQSSEESVARRDTGFAEDFSLLRNILNSLPQMIRNAPGTPWTVSFSFAETNLDLGYLGRHSGDTHQFVARITTSNSALTTGSYRFVIPLDPSTRGSTDPREQSQTRDINMQITQFIQGMVAHPDLGAALSQRSSLVRNGRGTQRLITGSPQSTVSV
ncbi:hypothetical protein OPQ81_007644 [Rhizoctonia solani]|nr:hypothetical protein OPQ81_007644 [Rhizoctonia solani]